MCGIRMESPLQLLKRRCRELDSQMKEVASPEVASNINSLRMYYNEAIEKLEA